MRASSADVEMGMRILSVHTVYRKVDRKATFSEIFD